jgi:hypothetical protein
MSSTNRGGQRHADDFYATPAWVTRAIMPYLPDRGDVLDPCSGEGAILDAFATTPIEAHCGAAMRVCVGIELDQGRGETCRARGHLVTIEDALLTPWPDVPLIITNPPFAIAEELVRRAITFATETQGVVAMLLRLAFLESAKRIPLHRDYPADVYPLAHRPSFTTNGKTDSCAYAWFVWNMAETNAAERKIFGGHTRVLIDAPPPNRIRKAA